MGDSDIASSLYNGGSDVWRARAGLIYATAGANQLFQGKKELPLENYTYNYRELRMAMQLYSLSAGVDAPWGTGVSVLLPYAMLRYDDWLTDMPKGKPIRTNDFGDPEFRIRQSVLAPFHLPDWPRVYVTAGVVKPNRGAYTNNTTKELSISRGAWWLLGELDVNLDLPKGFGLAASGGVRKALDYASDGDPDPNGLGWGNEYRAGLSARYMLDLPTADGWANYLIPKRLMLAVNGEFMRRAQATVVENLEAGRQFFPDSGGDYVNLTPTFLVAYNDMWSATASARVPLYRDVGGEQPDQYTSWFFGLNWSWSSTPSPPPPKPLAAIGQPPGTDEIARLLVAGKYTLIDYWATWCEPCGRLGKKLEEELPQRPGVALARVDATTWEAAEWAKFLPGAPGIPVLDLYDRQGKLVVRLQGDDCFAYAQHLPADATVAAP